MASKQDDQQQLLELLLASGSLKFGAFQTKSGRSSPYFINTGAIASGQGMRQWCDFYADAILKRWGAHSFSCLFGPAYKGIPLAVGTSMALAAKGTNCDFAYNRKEAKEHGEGGSLVGRPLKKGDQVIVVEDVLTGGTSLRETVKLLDPMGVKILGCVISVDREERGSGQTSARKEMESQLGIPIESLLTITEVVDRLWNQEVLGKVWVHDDQKLAIDRYRSIYGGS